MCFEGVYSIRIVVPVIAAVTEAVRIFAPFGEALDRAVGWWKRIATHVQEVFFGDLIGAGVVFNESQDGAGYKIVSTPYGIDQKQQLVAPTIDAGTIYAVLRQVAGA